MSRLIMEDLKKIMGDVITKSAPSDIVVGAVVSVDPLTIEIDKNTDYYDPACFIIPQRLTDHEREISFENQELKGTISISGGTGDGTYTCEGKEMSFDGKITIKNGIKEGDTLLMLRCMGGQRFLVLDRMGTGNG